MLTHVESPAEPACLRIAMVTMSLYPQDPRVRREAECVARCGASVDVVCLQENGQPERQQYDSVTVHRVLPAREKRSVGSYLVLSWHFYQAAARSLASLHRRHPIDLLHVHNLPDYLVFVGRPFHKQGVPILLDLHDLMPELYASRWSGSAWGALLPLVHRAHRASCAFADHLLTASEGFRTRLLTRGVAEDHVSLILNSADHHIFQAAARPARNDDDPVRLLYHGTVAPRFGIHHLVESLGPLQQALGNITLRIHGKYDTAYRSQLEGKVRDLGLQDQVTLGEYLSLEDIREVIQQSDLGIVPYESDTFMDLALSTKVFEYIAMGLPVVVSRLPSIELLFDGESVRYFEPGDSEDLARQVVDLWSDPSRRRALASHALAAYEPYSWPVMERRYLAAVTRLTGVELAPCKTSSL